MERVENLLMSCWNGMLNCLSRSPWRESCAEFLGTFLLTLIGDAVMATTVLSRLDKHSTIVGSIGWGIALMFAVAVTGGVSGGHANPAVTLGLAFVNACPWRNVMAYFFAQYIGSFLGACLVYLVYADAIYEFDGGVRQLPPDANATAQIFSTFPQDYASGVTCFLDQTVGTALLLIIICAATDSGNLKVPSYIQPLIIGMGLSGIVMGFGQNCGAPLNPARDFSPRIFTAISGWGVKVFSYRNYTWFWIPIIGPHLGGVIGAWLYAFFIKLLSQNYSILLNECGTEGGAREEVTTPLIVESGPSNLEAVISEGKKIEH